MKCVECGTAMVTKRENRRYEAGGLPHVVLLGVEVRRCPKCGAEEMAIPRVEELHRVIAQALIRKPARLAGSEIRYLRKYLGWSSMDFASRMGAARETVSRWEGGASPIGTQADRLLRLLVASTAPVKDYSSEDLLQIKEKPTTPTPVRLNLTADRQGWHPKAA
jgi:putative zinc finger/helix-turn-helix YgiT family protein